MINRTLVIKRSIRQVVDDPDRAVQLEQLFLTGPARPKKPGRGAPGSKRSRPAGFWRDASKVAAQVAAMLDGDVAHIVTIGGPGSGGVSLATSELATRRIMQGTHRLATPEEIEAFERSDRVERS